MSPERQRPQINAEALAEKFKRESDGDIKEEVKLWAKHGAKLLAREARNMAAADFREENYSDETYYNFRMGYYALERVESMCFHRGVRREVAYKPIRKGLQTENIIVDDDVFDISEAMKMHRVPPSLADQVLDEIVYQFSKSKQTDFISDFVSGSEPSRVMVMPPNNFQLPESAQDYQGPVSLDHPDDPVVFERDASGEIQTRIPQNPNGYLRPPQDFSHTPYEVRLSMGMVDNIPKPYKPE